jgi:nucleoside-diphosphate-sugar epimerase
MRTVIITGAGGYLGTTLIHQLLEETDYTIVAMTSQLENLKSRYKKVPRVQCFGNECFWKHALPIEYADALVHLAFSRRFSPDHEIAQSIEFSRYVFETAKLSNVSKLIYISSQGVYGNTSDLRVVGKTKPSPSALYTLAKYAAEQLLWSVFSGDDRITATAIRLDSVAGNQKMLPTFVQSCVEKQHISVVGGGQVFSFLDVRDAASGLIALLNTPAEIWKPIYNLGGHDRRYNILELAALTAEVAEEQGFGRVTISVERREITQFAGMDSKDFLKDTRWTPRYDMKAIISKLFDEYLEKADKLRGNI